jgi:hypothetical protein
MYPHAADSLLFPGSVIYQFALAEYLTGNPPSFGISVNDAMPKNASIFGKHREVVAFFQALQALVTPVSILSDKSVLLNRPPAAFRAGFTEEEADSPSSLSSSDHS